MNKNWKIGKLKTPHNQGRMKGERRGRPLPLGKFDTPRGYQNNIFSFENKDCLMIIEHCTVL